MATHRVILQGMAILALLSIIAACGGGGASAPTQTVVSSATTSLATTAIVTQAALLPTAAPTAATQSSTASCSNTVTAALDAVKNRCSALGSNQVCYGNPQIQTTLANQVNFQAPGDTVRIADLKTIHTQPYSQQDHTWGIAVLRAAVDLPGTSGGQQVTFLMYGDTALDSISADMKTVYFHTGVGQQSCEALPPSGLIVQVPRGQHIHFSANGADVTLGSTALMQAQPDQQFTLSVVQGQGTVTAQGVTQTVQEGFQTNVPLKGTTASAPPTPPKPIPVQAVNAAPTTILPEPITSSQIQQVISVATASAATGLTPIVQASITPLITWTPGPTLPPVAGGQKRIAFVSTRDGKHDIYLMNGDGSAVVRLTTTQTDAGSPAWSPDGRRVAFSLFTGSTRRINVINSDASGLVALSSASVDADHPAWSPDGTLLAFDGLTNGNRDIWIMNADGTNAHAIASDPADDAQPVWAPDGKRIAFASMRGGTRQIFVTNADGSGVQRLTDGGGTQPTWSPDGKSIAFIAQPSGSLTVMNADGTAPKRIASNAIDSGLAWSPDGAQIAYVSSVEGAQAIYIMGANGTDKPQRLTPLTSDNSSPAWQR